MSLKNIIARVAVYAPALPETAAVQNHTVGNGTAQHYSCDKKCTAITLGVTLPLLFILSVAAIAYLVWYRRQQQRKEVQRKEEKEREIALRKLGGSEVWEGRSASDEVSVRDGGEGDNRRHGHLEDVRIV